MSNKTLTIIHQIEITFKQGETNEIKFSISPQDLPQTVQQNPISTVNNNEVDLIEAMTDYPFTD